LNIFKTLKCVKDGAKLAAYAGKLSAADVVKLNAV